MPILTIHHTPEEQVHIRAHRKIKDTSLWGPVSHLNEVLPEGANLIQAAAEGEVTFHSECLDFKSYSSFLN